MSALPLIDAAFDGPLDVVGDVHGEIEALEQLLEVLGYTGRGEHAGARRLVFIGDLYDRGTDSPAVIRRVREMVEEGTAQCLLGNHELNVLRGARKEANGCVGARFAERRRWPGEPFRSRLGAVRWPERELIFDDGSGAGLSEAVRTPS